MIKVNDLKGTVTMSLTDYETLRDRVDEHTKDVDKFEKGLFRVADYIYHDMHGDDYTTHTEISWLDKDTIYTDMRGTVESVRALNIKLTTCIHKIKTALYDTHHRKLRKALLQIIKQLDIF